MLNDQNRQNLDQIVLKMSEQNAPQEDVQAVVNDFKQKYDKPENIQNKQNISLSDTIISNAKGVLNQFQAGQQKTSDDLSNLLLSDPKLRPKQENINAGEPQGLIQQMARLGGEYLAPQPQFTGGLPIPGMGLADEAGKVLSKGVLKSAPILNPLKAGIKEALAWTGSLMSSIPKEAYNRVLNNREILKAPFDDKGTFEDIGKTAQKAVNAVTQKAGNEVGQEKAVLKRLVTIAPEKTELDPIPFIDYINKEADKRIYNEYQSLSDLDLKKLNEVQEMFVPKKGEHLTDERLLGIKDSLKNMIKWSDQTVSKASPQAQAILENTYGKINDYLYKKYPDLERVNTKFAELAQAKNKLLPKIKDENVARNLKNIASRDQVTQEALYHMDELAPNSLKFMDKLQDAIARSKFEPAFPGQGGGSGGTEGFANLLRVNAANAIPGSNLMKFLTLGATSPLVHKQAIKGADTLLKSTGKIPANVSIPLLTKILGKNIFYGGE